MRTLITFFITFLTTSLFAQKQDGDIWSLEKCYQEAKKNNFDLLRTNVYKEQSLVNLNTSKNAFYPEISAGLRIAGNSGLFIDPATNMLTRTFNTNSHSFLLVDITLFNGFKNHYDIKVHEIESQNADLQYKKSLNEVHLNITVRYYEVLYVQEQLKNAEERLKQVKLQRDYINAQVKQGILHQRDFFNIEYAVSSEERNVVEAQNQVELAKLNLMQGMGMQGNELIEIKEDNLTGLLEQNMDSFEEISSISKLRLPEFKILNNQLKQNQYKIKSINAERYPSLGIDGIFGTRTSTLVPESNFDQVYNNNYQYIGLNLNIPVFNRNFYRNSVRIAELHQRDIELSLSQVTLDIDQQILATKLNIKGALKIYEASVKQYEAVFQEYIYAEKLFKIGTVNVVEFSEVRNRYIISQSRCLQDKYDCAIKIKVLDYYNGNFINNF